MVPRAVLMKSGLVSLNTARQVNTAHPKITMNSARPMTNLFNKAHSTLTDESQVLLKVPRKNNMYSVDLKNIVPKGGTKACDDAGKARMETVPGKDYIILPLWTADSPFSQSLKIYPDVNAIGGKTSIELPDDPNMPALEDIVYSDNDEDIGAEADMNNLDAFMPVSPFPIQEYQRSSS
ncbi:hypothetical protein Tco_0226644 [Tanacetum coccineum]